MQPSVLLVGVCFPVGKAAPRRGVTHPPPSTTEVKERVDVYLCSPYGPSWSVLGPNVPPLYRADDADVVGNHPMVLGQVVCAVVGRSDVKCTTFILKRLHKV